jgi:hypothetical protein
MLGIVCGNPFDNAAVDMPAANLIRQGAIGERDSGYHGR